MAEPAIKGVGFQATWERLTRLLEEGRLSREEAEFRLESEGMALLESKPEPTLWYPIAATDRLTRLLIDLEGDGHEEYARELGRRGLAAIQGRTSLREFLEGAVRRGERAGPTLIGLAGLVYNFGEWTFRGDDLRRFEVEARGVAPLSRLGVLAAAGFMEALASAYLGVEVRVEIGRPTPDVVLFRAAPAEGRGAVS